MHFERQHAFQNACIFFPEFFFMTCVPTLPKILRPITQNTLIFLFGLIIVSDQA